MSEALAPPPRERILVLLDASRASLAALEAAVAHAVSRQAELHAVFVEDIRLLRSAGFDFAREVGAVSGTSRQASIEAIEARLRRQIRRVRQALEAAVDGHRVAYSFSVRRGSVVQEILGLTGPNDLVVLGKVGWSGTPGRTLGSTARALAREAPGSVLLWDLGAVRREGPVLVVIDDFETSRKALTTALVLARQRQRPLTLLLLTLPEPGATEARDHAVSEWLEQAQVDVRQRRLPSLSPLAIVRTLREERGCELVVSRQSRLLQDTQAESLLEALTLPVVVSA